MKRKAVNSSQAPQAIGAYSQAVRAGDTVYISGQIALSTYSEHLIEGDISAQIRQVFDNLSAICKAAGGRLNDIVKLTVYLIDLSHIAMVNDIMAEYFSESYPARAAIGVSALPKNADVEMDAVLVL